MNRELSYEAGRQAGQRATVVIVAKVLDELTGKDLLAEIINCLINVYDFETLSDEEVSVGERLLDELHARCPDAVDRVMARLNKPNPSDPS